METSTLVATPVASDLTADRWRRDRLFYGGFTAGAIAVVFAGFGRTYYLGALTNSAPLPPLVHLHAAVYSAWMVLFAVQASLVAARRVSMHRRLGAMSVILAIAMVAAGWVVSIDGARTGWAGPREPRDAAEALRFLAVPIGDLIVFTGFYSAALYFRRIPDTHKRLMVLAMVGGVLPPALGRLPITAAIIATFGLLLAGPVYDRVSCGRIQHAYIWGVPIVFASLPLRFAIARTEAWRQFAQWVIS